MFITFRRNFRAMATCGIDFQFFCVFWKVLETNFSHVYSGKAMKDADKVEGQKYAYYQSFGGSENHVLH